MSAPIPPTLAIPLQAIEECAKDIDRESDSESVLDRAHEIRQHVASLRRRLEEAESERAANTAEARLVALVERIETRLTEHAKDAARLDALEREAHAFGGIEIDVLGAGTDQPTVTVDVTTHNGATTVLGAECLTLRGAIDALNAARAATEVGR